MQTRTNRRNSIFLEAMLFCAMAAGCSNSAPTDATDYAAHCAGDALKNIGSGQRIILGTWRDTVMGSGGTGTEKAQDLSAATVSALVGDAFEEKPGYGSADGQFCVPGVPAGSYWLKVKVPTASKPYFYFTAADTIELGQVNLARSDDYIRETGTALELNLSGLATCAGGDQIDGFVPTLDGWAPFSTGRDAGNTTATFTSKSDLEGTSPLIDGSQGDRLFVIQRCETATDSGIFTLKSVSAELPAFTMTKGATTTQSAMLTAVAQDRSLQPSLKFSAFAAYEQALLGPGTASVSASSYLTSYAVPLSANQEAVTGATLVSLSLSDAAARQDQSPSITYGNPFPAAWSTVHQVALNSQFDVTAPGATMPFSFFPDVEVWTAGEALPPTGVVPLVSPVTALKVNGQDGWTAQTKIGLSPTLSWTAPALGTAANYFITFLELYADGTRSRIRASYVYTNETSFKLPPGILQSGKAYSFKVEARTGRSTAQHAAPNRLPLPFGAASTMSALMTVD